MIDVSSLRPLVHSAALDLRQRRALQALLAEHDEAARSTRSEDDTQRLVRPEVGR